MFLPVGLSLLNGDELPGDKIEVVDFLDGKLQMFGSVGQQDKAVQARRQRGALENT